MHIGPGWLYVGALSRAEQRLAHVVTVRLLRAWNLGWHERAIRIAAAERAGLDVRRVA